MFVTEKMHRVNLFLPREDLTRFWHKLGRFGELQPEEIRRISRLKERLSFVDLSDLSAKLREAAGFLNIDLNGPLDDPAVTPLSPTALKEKLEEISSELGAARSRLQSLREEQRAIEREFDKLAVQEAHLKLLEPLEVDIGALLHLKRFSVLAGTLPEDNLDPLERSLRRFPHALLPYRREVHRLQLLVVCLNEDRQQVEDILESALFRLLELPEGLKGSPKESLQLLEERKKKLIKRREKLDQALSKFEAWQREKQKELSDFLKINYAILNAHERPGETQPVALATGWVPARDLPRLQTLVQEEPTWVLQSEEVPYQKAKDDDGLPVPSKLHNPPFFRAFEGIVSLYGTPRYGGFDPTIIFSGFFIALFGMMFGDLGHGFILFLSGLMLRLWPRLRAGFRRTGTILIPVGISSMLFGALYGSFFGYENIIPALWFRPMDEINRLLMYAILIGVCVILIGIFVNILSKGIQRRYVELFFERFGVLGLWFYLGALTMVFLFTKGHTLGIGTILVLMFLPLLLMPLEKPIERWLHRSEKHEEGEGKLVALITVGVDLFEAMIVYLSNSISFVRVAAFALNHAALSLAIFQLGTMLRQLPLGGVIYIITIAGGNLLILVLEGGIVGIQVLRLEFYEFFTKFFEEGTAFRPFKLEFRRR